jgi:hypothetical protein
MSIQVAVSAFAHRGARRSTAVQLVAYSVAIAVCLLLIAAWICRSAEGPPGGACYWKECQPLPDLPWSVLGLADVFALGLSALALLVVAPVAAAAQVAAERRAGTHDQLRTTPLSPLGLLSGIVVGAPAKVYLLALGPLGLHVASGLLGAVPLDSVIESLAVLGCGALASVLLAVAVALAPRQDAGGAMASLGVGALLAVGAVATYVMSMHSHDVGWAYLHPGGALSAAMLQHDGIWRRLVISRWELSTWNDAQCAARLATTAVASCVSSLALAALLAAACCRKLAAPHRPLFGKLQSLVLFAGVAAGVLAPFRGHLNEWDRAPTMTVAFAFLLLPLALVLGTCAAPSYESWALALRRGRVAPHRDDAPPHAAMWAMVAVLAGLSLLVLDGQSWTMPRLQPVALGWLVAVALTLPIYVHFLSTRYATAAGRWAFGAAIVVHLLIQAIGIVALLDERDLSNLFVRLAALAGVAVPVAVALAQRALAQRTAGHRASAAAPVPPEAGLAG